jgi:hypothetical protein
MWKMMDVMGKSFALSFVWVALRDGSGSGLFTLKPVLAREMKDMVTEMARVARRTRVVSKYDVKLALSCHQH